MMRSIVDALFIVVGVALAVAAIFLFGAGASGCAKTVQVPPPADAASFVYMRLVAAGCLAPSDDGVDSIAQAHTLPDEPAWLGCLFDGGSILRCNTPCDQSDAGR